VGPSQKSGTYLDNINQVLNRYQDATTGAAQLAGRALGKDNPCYVRLAQERKAIM